MAYVIHRAEIVRLAARGRPYIFLPQAFGPFSRSRAAARSGAALDRAALVCVRDGRSRRFLSELNPRLAERLELLDCSIDVAADASAAARWGVDDQTVLLVPNHQMTTARNPDDAWRAGYVGFLADLAMLLRRRGAA